MCKFCRVTMTELYTIQRSMVKIIFFFLITYEYMLKLFPNFSYSIFRYCRLF